MVHRVLVLTGAGVSAESGIPTFRGKDGYWRDLDPTKLATLEAFERNPELVWEWYRERRQCIRHAQPNAAHAAIAKLSIHASDFLLVTQNVDDLHARAGVGKEKMVQIHGDIFLTRCSRCDLTHREQEQQGKDVELPKCSECDALMRPGAVWFGEQLDPVKIDIVESYLARGACDVVIVAGTTRHVWIHRRLGAASRRKNGQLIEVNPEKTSLSQFATRVVREAAVIALPRLIDEL
jgi:NAD-dependent deacetylase